MSAAAKHTAGPWTVGDGSVPGDKAQRFVHADESPAGWRLPAICPSPNALANATLIAAAPELLEALRLILPLAENWADGKGRSHPDHECVAAARAAIARATGGTP